MALTVTRYEGQGYNLSATLDIYTVPANKIAKVKMNPITYKEGAGGNIMSYREMYSYFNYNPGVLSYLKGGNYIHANDAELRVGTHPILTNVSGQGVFLHLWGDNVLTCAITYQSLTSTLNLKDFFDYQTGTAITDFDSGYVVVKEIKNEFIITEGEKISMVYVGANSNADYRYDFIVFEEDL
jgi:hypothetical protein